MLSTKKEKSPSAGLILVVDDNEINRYVTNKILTQCGFEVDLAEDGQIAVDKVATKQYDLILMDLHMPIMDGYEATIRLRQQGVHIPIIALTANLPNEIDEKLKNVGINNVVVKPFLPDGLYRTILHHVS